MGRQALRDRRTDRKNGCSVDHVDERKEPAETLTGFEIR
jgi:hypothetical protein